MLSVLKAFDTSHRFHLSEVPEGMEPLVVGDLAKGLHQGSADKSQTLVVVLSDGRKMDRFASGLKFFAPDVDCLMFPAWDCVPYDRASPSAAVLGDRMRTLAELVRTKGGTRARVLLTTANALVQRVPSQAYMAGTSLVLKPGQMLNDKDLIYWLEANGFMRSTTVRESGEYAVRGGLIDLFPPALGEPVRLDFFGQTLESLRTFDAETQRTIASLSGLNLVPSSELSLTTETMVKFRQGYSAKFGGNVLHDSIYEAVSEGRRIVGMEHYLPLFHDGLGTLFDFVEGVPFVLDSNAENAIDARLENISEHFEARQEAFESEGAQASYKPLEIASLYLNRSEIDAQLSARACAQISAYSIEGKAFALGGRLGRNFAPERAQEGVNVFDVVRTHIEQAQASQKRVLIAAWSAGSRERMAHVLLDHGLKGVVVAPTYRAALEESLQSTCVATLALEQGFESNQLVVLSEQDILGERMGRGRAKSRKAHDMLLELQNLGAGDLVVHVEHGIGRFVGLKAVDVAGASHECLEIHYSGGDKLYLPVENIDLITRYGSEQAGVELDRLGSASWQNRKAKFKKRIAEIAQYLVQIAAERQLRKATELRVSESQYEEFCAGFPYEETEDQLTAIDVVMADLASGKPMDRLICGDVGFGKTEVALRAAFIAAMSGQQVAVVVPTTLLARQHYHNFAQRFKNFPLRVEQASRLVSSTQLRSTKQGLAEGQVDVVVGTHALLSKNIAFQNLGLVIVDEEQHFGVNHKERLKQLTATVHVLTLTATPIPRTLQMAMSGVRDMSLMTTAPVDRLSIRTSVAPLDPFLMREALLRERYRGGKSFFVCPRIEDLGHARALLDEHVPELRVITAHGQMPPTDIEDRIGAFYEGKADVLLSTTIVESGLDIPSANTLIVYRADMFGLSQLYQLRGRVGRSKQRAYALLTLPMKGKITPGAEKRLQILQSLDTLGAGFQLASHDLDMRGAGNLLGDEQSGHIKEVGFELYQQMLEEAVEKLKSGHVQSFDDKWSPQINLGLTVLIPETYVPDLDLRLGLYRRLASFDDGAELHGFAAELTDRFGTLPKETELLLKVMAIKILCRKANVEKVEAGPKGFVMSFRNNAFANLEGLVHFVAKQGDGAKVRPDMKIVFVRDIAHPQDRLKSVEAVLTEMVALVEAKQ